MATSGLLVLGVVLILSLFVLALVAAASSKRDDWHRDQFSEERAARLAQMQAAWYSSRHADAGRTNRAA